MLPLPTRRPRIARAPLRSREPGGRAARDGVAAAVSDLPVSAVPADTFLGVSDEFLE